MKRTIALFVGLSISALGLVGCSDSVPDPGYSQNRAIDQDIDATHAGMPSLATPTLATENRDPSPLPWRNEEQTGVEQSGQLPQ